MYKRSTAVKQAVHPKRFRESSGWKESIRKPFSTIRRSRLRSGRARKSSTRTPCRRKNLCHRSGDAGSGNEGIRRSLFVTPKKSSNQKSTHTATGLERTKRKSGDHADRRKSLRLSSRSDELLDARHPELIPGAHNNLIHSSFLDVFNKAKLERVDIDQCLSVEELRVRPLYDFGIRKTISLLKRGSIGMVTGYVHVGKFPVIVELPSSYRSTVTDIFVARGREQGLTERWVSSRTIYHVVNGGYEHAARCRLAEED